MGLEQIIVDIERHRRSTERLVVGLGGADPLVAQLAGHLRTSNTELGRLAARLESLVTPGPDPRRPRPARGEPPC